MTIDDCVALYFPEGAEATKAGSQFWFVDKDRLGGRTLKMSVVGPGQGAHAPHTHAQEEFFFVLEGIAEFFLDGEVRLAPAYSSLYCPPNRSHGIHNPGTTDLKYLVIKTYPETSA